MGKNDRMRIGVETVWQVLVGSFSSGEEDHETVKETV